MKADLISIIIPIYKVEQYLSKCVDSIINQTYSNLEVILVDDGSPDKCGQICDDYARRDNRIKVIHKENGGLSDARNAGLAIATGEYISFCDSDDWIEKDAYNNIIDYMRSNHSDVVIWGYVADFLDENEGIISSNYVVPDKFHCVKGNYLKLYEAKNLGLMGYAWNKMYRSQILKENSILFSSGVSLVEDILFNEKVFTHIQKMSFFNYAYSHYMQRKRETLGTRFYPDYYTLKLQACNARTNIIKAFGATEEELEHSMYKEHFGVLESTIRMVSRQNKMTFTEKKEYLRETFNNQTAQSIVMNNNKMDFRHSTVRMLLRTRMYGVLIRLFSR